MVYVGSYAGPDQEGIWLYNLNPETGELARVKGFKAGPNPSYLALDEARRYLYAVNETGDYQGKNSGAVSAFAVDRQTGDLTLLNQVPSEGGAPCHISFGNAGKTVLVANYMGGNVAAFPVQENGSLGETQSVQQHKGAGPDKDRQEAAHAHYIGQSPDSKYVFAVDLGIDQVLGYRLDSRTGALSPNEPTVAFATKPGAGPRHMVFHPGGRYAYVINELNSTMTALAYDGEKGTFSEVKSISTLPADSKGENSCAAVKVSPDGKFLYGSNRGHNSIVVYAIDGSTGKLTLVQHQDTGGDWPRDFTIDLTGNVLLVANERSNNIVTYKIDKASGKLTPTGHRVEVQKPVCLQVVPAFSQQ
ncbi:hypothetical protein OB13_07400 [Pontibacter sp. HJ8]